jgi:hypothetical protein
VTVAGVPELLTVEEAADHLRIGRTKAYAMALEWRRTGGRSGLPVVDLGHVLRVRRSALEELIGGELTDDRATGRPCTRADAARPGEALKQPAAADVASVLEDENATTRPTRPRRRKPYQATNQLDLFNPEPDAS